MNITTKQIPLMIASGLSLASVFMSSFSPLSFSMDAINPDSSYLFGLIGFALTWASMFLKRQIWVYAFLIVMGAAFTQYVEVSFLRFSLHINSFELNFINLALLIAHMVLNFGDKDESTPPPPEGGWTKVNWFKHQHQNKTDEEIQRMLDGELVSEARQALEEILESRNNKQD